MCGSEDANKGQGFNLLLACRSWDYLSGYFINKLPSFTRTNEDVELSNPQAHITLTPTLRMKIKGSLLHLVLYPFATLREGRDLTREESRKLRKSLIEDCDIK